MIIFQVMLKEVLDETKTQTRRVKKPGEWYSPSRQAVMTANGRVKWRVGQEHAICPGRGKKQVGRLRIKLLRWEYLQDITEEDARAEGVNESYWDRLPSYKDRCLPGHLCRAAFADVWTTLNYPKGKRWEDDPEVWVIEFERVS